jgi:hypothetical protein
MPFESEQFLPRVGIPGFYRSVITTAEDSFAVGAETHGEDWPPMPFESENYQSRVSIPDYYVAILTTA